MRSPTFTLGGPLVEKLFPKSVSKCVQNFNFLPLKMSVDDDDDRNTCKVHNGLVNDTCKYYLQYRHWYFLLKVSVIPILTLLHKFCKKISVTVLLILLATATCTHNFIS